MATDDRKIFVDTQYPAPSFVDGIVRINPNTPPELDPWDEVPDIDSSSLSTDESAGINDVIQVPYPLEVVEQKVVTAVSGESEVQAILVIQDIPGINDYDVRIVMR